MSITDEVGYKEDNPHMFKNEESSDGELDKDNKSSSSFVDLLRDVDCQLKKQHELIDLLEEKLRPVLIRRVNQEDESEDKASVEVLKSSDSILISYLKQKQVWIDRSTQKIAQLICDIQL